MTTHSEVEFPFKLAAKAQSVLRNHPKYWKEENDVWMFKPQLSNQEISQMDSILRQNLVMIKQSVNDEPIPLESKDDLMSMELQKDGYIQSYENGKPIPPYKELTDEVLARYKKKFGISN